MYYITIVDKDQIDIFNNRDVDKPGILINKIFSAGTAMFYPDDENSMIDFICKILYAIVNPNGRSTEITWCTKEDTVLTLETSSLISDVIALNFNTVNEPKVSVKTDTIIHVCLFILADLCGLEKETVIETDKNKVKLTTSKSTDGTDLAEDIALTYNIVYKSNNMANGTYTLAYPNIANVLAKGTTYNVSID